MKFPRQLMCYALAVGIMVLSGCSARTYELDSGPGNDLIAWQLDWVTEDLLAENRIDRLFVQFSEKNWNAAKKYQGITNVCFIDGGKDWTHQTMIDYLDAYIYVSAVGSNTGESSFYGQSITAIDGSYISFYYDSSTSRYDIKYEKYTLEHHIG